TGPRGELRALPARLRRRPHASGARPGRRRAVLHRARARAGDDAPCGLRRRARAAPVERPCDRYRRTVFSAPTVVLAPLACGPSTPELAAAVSNAGGLGFVAAGYLSADELAARIAQARRLTDGPLAVNVFVLARPEVDFEAVAAYAHE